MLVLTRKKGEELVVRMEEGDVIVRIVDITRDRVRLGITAPRSVSVHREEIHRRIMSEQLIEAQLAERATSDES